MSDIRTHNAATSPIGLLMSDDLRTRIAAAISGVDDWRGVTDPTILADEVIRELNLRQEQLGEDIGHPHPQRRYVTDWTADD